MAFFINANYSVILIILQIFKENQMSRKVGAIKRTIDIFIKANSLLKIVVYCMFTKYKFNNK